MNDEPMASPIYRAAMRRDAAIREAQAVCRAEIHAAYVKLERAEQAARDTYDAESAAILRDACAQWEENRKAAA